MPAIPAPVQLRCEGCNTYFDSHADLAPLQVGTALHKFCRRCFRTSTGPGDITFDDAQKFSREEPGAVAGP